MPWYEKTPWAKLWSSSELVDSLWVFGILYAPNYMGDLFAKWIYDLVFGGDDPFPLLPPSKFYFTNANYIIDKVQIIAKKIP